MLQAETLKNNVFNKRGNFPPGFLKTLSIKAGDTHVDDAIKRFGWNGLQTVAVPIVSTQPGTGQVLGSRWEIRGPISKRTMKANTIWTDVDPSISISWDLDGKTSDINSILHLFLPE